MTKTPDEDQLEERIDATLGQILAYRVPLLPGENVESVARFLFEQHRIAERRRTMMMVNLLALAALGTIHWLFADASPPTGEAATPLAVYTGRSLVGAVLALGLVGHILCDLRQVAEERWLAHSLEDRSHIPGIHQLAKEVRFTIYFGALGLRLVRRRPGG